MTVITKEIALKIIKKLDAKIDERPKKRHDFARVYYAGRLIATFGIRRGSKKGSGHDHIPSQLYISPHQAKQLGQCPLSRKEWINILRKKEMA